MKQDTHYILWLRSSIFPGEEQKGMSIHNKRILHTVRDPNNPPFCKIAFFFLRETDFFVSVLNPALFLSSVSFCSLVNGTFPLKMLSAHSHRESTRLRTALVMRCLRIHGLAFC
jgi:hypothetical protein